jgi:hypothetical protein
VSQHSRYSDGYLADTPAPGDVYIQALVSYQALQNGVDYNGLDFDVYANSTAANNSPFVTTGPAPTLVSGTLTKGLRARGWVVYEVPLQGRVVMSYNSYTNPDGSPIFQVVIRPH